ncbi:MAG: 30S ribosome-binding factor RbfA [Arsenophonus sp.]|nr:MAG: 30S ribosome-binding factor RbfA [Arsenophonus sp.]
MNKFHTRSERISNEIKKTIASILQKTIRNPKIKMTNVLDVKISRDLLYAKIFVTFLNLVNDKKKTIKNNIFLLNYLSGYIRFLLGKEIYLKILPQLFFIYDDSLDKGIMISKIIRDVIYKKK